MQLTYFKGRKILRKFILFTGCPISYHKYILQITRPSQNKYTKLQYRFAVISEAPSILHLKLLLYVQEVMTQFILFSLKNRRLILVQVKYSTILYVQEVLTHFILYIVHKIIFILGMILPRPNSSMSSA